MAAMERRSASISRKWRTPDEATWEWESMKPGTTVWLARSILRVLAVARERISSLEPTARKRPFEMATA